MITVLGWYLAVTLIGALAWPLAFRLLPGLPDRGYTLSRALGLLLVGYVFWLLGTLGLLHNSVGSILFAGLIVAGVAIWVYRTGRTEAANLTDWLRGHSWFVVIAESLYVIAFIFWVIVRAYNPDISGTEKPMELAFLNGVRSSPAFPPRDPWLSGYAISYYYFGYVIVALLADLSGAISSVAFNLAIPTLFALTLLGCFGLIYNLVGVFHQEETNATPPVRHAVATLSGLLGALMVAVMGNLEGFLELLYNLNLPFVGDRFWTWLDIEDLNVPGNTATPPGQWRFWWWWRASRVIHDRDLTGASIGLQPIDEFPFFSFLLGDMHPHVLALPFVMLALGLAFNALAQTDRLDRRQWALYGLAFGGLAFLNTWDLPIYLFILVAALVVRRVREAGGLHLKYLRDPLVAGGSILAIGVIAYLPWYVGFTSQAGGILPNALFPTRLHQFLVMFSPFVVILLWFLIVQAIRYRQRLDLLNATILGLGLLLFLVALAFALGTAAMRADPGVRDFVFASTGLPVGGLAEEEIAAQTQTAIRTIALHRLNHPLTSVLLTAIIILALARLLPQTAGPAGDDEASASLSPFSASTGFVLILILTGAMLALGPEYVYLRDNFGQRLNTIFKFYYAAWVLFGVAAAYAIPVIVARQPFALHLPFAILITLLVLAGSVYPAFSILDRVGLFAREPSDPLPTLDGIAYIERQYPGDYAGIVWLQQNADRDAVVLEAVGGAYSYYGRVSSATGLPTVMGWSNHERQWRGDLYDALAGTRETDVVEIYNTPSIERALELLRRYDVTYVFVGSLEQSPAFASPRGLAKFDRFLRVVYRDAGVTIYQVDSAVVEETP